MDGPGGLCCQTTGTYLGTVLLEAHQIEKQREGKMVTDKGNILNV